MATPHIESKREDISDVVLMPGDPLRAEYIAKNYLEDVIIVNKVRNMVAYTGIYKGRKVTVFPSGMGIPSMGIYAYELYKFYDVNKIIRIGTCGAGNPDVKVLDIVLADSAYSTSSFAKLMFDQDAKEYQASLDLNNNIYKVALAQGINIHRGPIITSEVFDVYVDYDKYIKNFPEFRYYAAEMEAFALFALAKNLNKEAACLLTVVDSKYQSDVVVSAADRQTSLDDMIKLALDSII